MLVLGQMSYGQDVIPTKGKEFWMGFMRNYLFNSEQSLDLFITSDVNTTGTVEMPLQGWSASFAVTANNTTTVSVPNVLAETFASEIIDGRGVHILTEDTVSVFAVNFKPISADGSKILPIQSLGTEYLISSYQGHQNFGSQFMIVATEDDTEIEIIPTALTYGGVAPGESTIINLDQGQTYQVFADLDDNGDFMGTLIRGTENNGSCRPFAVFSGASCADIPSDCLYCDHIFDQNFAVNTWGYDFYVPPLEFATGGYTYRVLASEDDTQVNINGTVTYNINAGDYIEFNDQILSQCINATKKISVTQYFQGIICAGDGDPSMLILNDVNQVIDNVTFSTMESDIITTHGLNIISQTAYIDQVSLDGVMIDPSEFVTFPSCPEISYAQITILEGTHTLESEFGFTAYVFGVGDDESYAYSVGSFFVEEELVNLVDSVICSNTQVVIDAPPTLSDVNWYLDDDETDPVATGNQIVLDVPFESGVYISQGLDDLSGCIEEELYLVEFNEPPVITANDSQICKYESVNLDFNIEPATDLLTIQWSPEVGLDDPNILSPLASPLETTEYTVEVTSSGGCGETIIETIEVEVLSGSISGMDLEIDQENVCEGTEVTLTGSVEEIVFEDNFDPGVSWGLWCDIANGSGSLACGSVSGAALYFNGFGDRHATTQAIDVSNGGNVVFNLKVASGVAPCDDTEFGEDIILEYSTTGCDGPFTEIQTFFEFSYPDFEEISVPIPPGAVTTNTHFRWRQISNSGNNQDNWSIDDVYIGIVQNDAYDFIWYPEEIFPVDGDEVNVAVPTQDTSIILEVLDNISGCAYQDSVAVHVFPNPDFNLPEDSILCSPELLELEPEMLSVGNYDFVWNSDDGSVVDDESQILSVTPTSNTTYHLEVIDQLSTCSDSTEIEVVVSELTDIELTSSAEGICLGEMVSYALDIQDGNSTTTVIWDSELDYEIVDELNTEATPDEDMTVAVTVVDDSTSCFLEDQVSVIVSMPFTIVAPEDIETCNAVGSDLSVASPDVDPNELTWDWAPANGLDVYDSPDVVVQNNTSEEYIITATNEYNCQATDTINIIIAFDNFDLGEDIELCEGENYVLETGFDNTHTFVWNGDPSLDDPFVIINGPGNYDVYIESDLGCSFEDELDVIYHPNPVVSLGPDQAHCIGETIELSSDITGVDFDWSTDETTQEIEVNSSGYYSILVTDDQGCEDTDEVYVVFNMLPVVDLPDSLFACENQDLILDAGADGELYEWSNDEETSIIIVEDTGTYSVIVTNEYGCTAEDETYCDFGASPSIILPPDMHFCEGDTVIVEPIEATEGEIIWSNGATGSSVEIYETEFLVATIENEYCEDSDAISISVHEIPNSPIAEEITICFDENPNGVPLAVFWNDATYYWSTGEFTNSITVEEGGLYYVDMTDPYGCTGRDSILINTFCPDTALYIPNSFTPNADGKNDHFYCVGKNIAEFDIEIYDRWGMIVYESNDIYERWDGSFNGGEHYVIKDSYTYVVKFRYYIDEVGTLSDYHQIDGYVTVVR